MDRGAVTAGARVRSNMAARGGKNPDGTALKLAEQVAADIEAEIMRREWPVGEVLASEAELVEQYEVSRSVLREAVRILESHGSARMRRGPGGGLVVTAPDATRVMEAAALYLNYSGTRPEDLFKVRAALELSCVRELVEGLNEERITVLRDAIAAEAETFRDGLPVDGHAQDIHILIAQLTGSPALALFVEVLTRLTRTRTVGKINEEQEAVEAVHHAHKAIVEAIVAGDLAVAQHRMTRHLRAIAEFAT